MIVGSLVLGAAAAPAQAEGGAMLNLRAAAASLATSQDGAAAQPALPATNGFADFYSGWKRSVDIGLSGAEGNSENFNIRGGVGAERKASDMETKAGISYKYATQDSTKSQSRGEAFAKTDYIFGDSPWGLFWNATLEYDEFQAWDWRATLAVGPTYTFIKNDRTLLRGRVGVGASYEFGGSAEEEVRPELNLGGDFEHKLTDRQKIFASVDVYPSLSDWPDYRVVAKAGWEILVDPEANMFLKLGLSDRYDSDPGAGQRKNDFEYFATLSWVF